MFDVKPYLEYNLFKLLKNKEMFKTAKVAELSIEWANRLIFAQMNYITIAHI